ncbi:MAG: InlB B-repeat-containing protein [Treponema sp.]
MKQKNWLRSILLLGSALMLFFSCNTANDPKDDGKDGFAINFSVEQPSGSTATLEAKDGTQAITSGAKVAKDTTIKFTLKGLASGYKVKSWEPADLTAAADKMSATLKVSKATNVKVILEANTPGQEKVTLKFSVEGNGGTLEAMIGTATQTTNTQIDKGASVVFTAKPAQGFKVKEWKGVNPAPSQADATTVTVTASTDLDVKVVFMQDTKDKVTLKFSVEGNGGTLEAMIGTATQTTNTQIDKGASVVFTAKPAQGFKVKEWKGVTPAPTTADATTVTVTASTDLDVKVTFEKEEKKLTQVTITKTDVQKDSGADAAKKRTFSFTVKYPEFTVSNPAEYIDTVITLDGDKAFPQNTKITLTYTKNKKGETGTPQSPVVYTVAETNVKKIFASKAFNTGNTRNQLVADLSEASEVSKIDIEFPTSGADEDKYTAMIKVALFADASTETPTTELGSTSFDIPGYNK